MGQFLHWPKRQTGRHSQLQIFAGRGWLRLDLSTVRVDMKGLNYALSKTEQLSSTGSLGHVQISATVNGSAVNVIAKPDGAQILMNTTASGRSSTTRLAGAQTCHLPPRFRSRSSRDVADPGREEQWSRTMGHHPQAGRFNPAGPACHLSRRTRHPEWHPDHGSPHRRHNRRHGNRPLLRP